MEDRHRHSRIHRRDAVKAAAAAVVLVVILLLGLTAIGRWEERTYAAGSETAEPAARQETITARDGTVYTAKQEVETYLMMGIDVDGPVVRSPGNYNGGQADAQFLLVLDNQAQTWQLLRLNRDSMVDVPVLDLKGKVIGYEHQQLALAHAYGDGTNNSCQNTADAVSALLGGQPIDGYAALNMDGIAVFNDAVGGVTVTIPSDFTAVDPALKEGETITLQGQQAMEFVRTRKDVDDQTNLARMERQRIYLEALQPQLLALDQEDVIRVADAVSDYLVTNIGSQTMLDLADKFKTYEELPELTIDGTSTIEEGHVAYILDQDSLQQVILQLFYQKQDN